MSETLLEVKDLRTQFKRGKKDWITAVNGVSFNVNAGEIVGLVGESGCGKSVTSLSVMRLHNERLTKISGSIKFGGKEVLDLTTSEMQSMRGNEMSMIFQEPMSALDPIMRIEDQLAEAISLHNSNMSKAEIHERCVNSLKLVGIPEPEMTLRNYPHELSGGMCQRVMIAMAMSCEPKLLIADEPTTALDVTIQAQILALMEDIRNRRNTGILLITHDLGVVAETCSRVIVMYAGNIVEEAPVKELFANPQHPYTEGLIASVPRLGKRLHRLPSIPGSVPDLSVMPEGCRFAPRCKYAQDSCKQKLPELQTVAEGHRCACPFYRNAREGAQQ
ncbi:ABC transporter ATP-binding protein [Collinsella bouchesdurhonensis]|uniref:ABC transporter ATP-binding protein n=1 Tax=Collinsella bouchesdurhonensis TaxID=1907654 RepID=UPI00096AC132|nr:ABC transporter ATP-binding protein [Collinsella bouchesdurhonensis]MDY3053491.1 ABC transporter ATP-binding protein [Collinsella bouchesdurhonensis]